MQNPFESGHIKNYILLYASVVVIMILFFIASTIFRQNKEIDKKVFSTELVEKSETMQESKEEEPSQTKKFKLLDKAY